MKKSGRPWSRAEKALLLAPALVFIAWVAIIAARRLQPGPERLYARSTSTFQTLAIASQGKILVAAGTDSNPTRSGEIWVWRTDNLSALDPVPSPVESAQFPGTWRLAISPDGALIARSTMVGDTEVLDVQTGRVRSRVPGIGRTSTCQSALSFSPDGKVLAVGNVAEILLYDVAGQKRIRSFKNCNSNQTFAFSPDGHLLGAVSSLDYSEKTDKSASHSEWVSLKGGQLSLYETTTGKSKLLLPLMNVQSFAFSPDSSHLFVLATDLQEKVSPLFKMERVASWTLQCRDTRSGNLQWQRKYDVAQTKQVPPLDIVCAPNGRFLASVNSSDNVQFFDAETGKLLHTLSTAASKTSGRASHAHGLAFSPDGRRIFCVQNMTDVKNTNGTPLYLWDVPQGLL